MTDPLIRVPFGYILLVATALTCVGFGYWLVSDSEAEKVTRFFIEYKELNLRNKVDEARKLHQRVLSTGGNDDEPLDEVWLPLVQALEDGYDKLSFYVRILAGDTEREATYEEIANLISRAPQAFNQELKKIYINELYEVPKVRLDLLEKYGLHAD